MLSTLSQESLEDDEEEKWRDVFKCEYITTLKSRWENTAKGKGASIFLYGLTPEGEWLRVVTMWTLRDTCQIEHEAQL